MANFESGFLPSEPNVVAPDGMSVRILLQTERGSMAHFQLNPQEVTTAIAHRTVEEIWYFTSGHGELWRALRGNAHVEPVEPGVCITLPAGTWFQLRSIGHELLTVLSITMPPWPGENEAYLVEGAWVPTIGLAAP